MLIQDILDQLKLKLFGDTSKAKKLGWSPKISFEELVKEMIYEDYKLAEKDKLINQQ